MPIYMYQELMESGSIKWILNIGDSKYKFDNKPTDNELFNFVEEVRRETKVHR